MKVAAPRNARNYASLKEATTIAAHLREAYAGQLTPLEHWQPERHSPEPQSRAKLEFKELFSHKGNKSTQRVIRLCFFFLYILVPFLGLGLFALRLPIVVDRSADPKLPPRIIEPRIAY